MSSPAEITRHRDPDPDENPWVHGAPRQETIHVVAYDPAWPHRYSALRDRILAGLGNRALAIDHVGSTAVPGLAAKPVIDIDLTVADPSDEASYVPSLEAQGKEPVIRDIYGRVFRAAGLL